MQLTIDENIPKDLITWIETKGHGAYGVPKGSSDEEVARITQTNNAVLLTLNRHFSNTLRFPPKDFPGIIRIKIHPSYIDDIMFSLEKLFTVFPNQEDFRGRLLILEKYGFFRLKK